MYGDSLYRPTQETTIFLYGATPIYFLVLSHLHTEIIHSILQASSDRFFLAILTIITIFLNTWRNSNLLGVLSHPFIAHPSPYRLRRLLSPRCRGEYFPKNYNLPPWQLWKIIFKAASSLRVFIPSTPPTSFLMGQAISHFKLPLTYACCTCRAGKKTCRTYRRFGHGID